MELRVGSEIVSQRIMCVLRLPSTQVVGINPEGRAYRTEDGKRESAMFGGMPSVHLSLTHSVN